jgi:hypothetical protein
MDQSPDMDFLKQSIASLNDDCHQLHASVRELSERLGKQSDLEEKRWRDLRNNVVAALIALLKDPGNGSEKA